MEGYLYSMGRDTTSDMDLSLWDVCQIYKTKGLSLEQAAKKIGKSSRQITRDLKSQFGKTWQNIPVVVEDTSHDTSMSSSPQPSHLSHLPPSDAPRRGAQTPATYSKLTEEVVEDAIVRVLQTNPEKAISVATSFLDKKKAISIEDQDEMEMSSKMKHYYQGVLENIYRDD